jgi:osmotically inducible protein OsmC
MVARRTARAEWEGNLMEGRGKVTTESSSVLVSQPVTWASRTEEPGGLTSPEELLAAAHAACFAMALSHGLDEAGTRPEHLEVTATATFDKVGDGFAVTTMEIEVRGKVPGIDNAWFEKAAQAAGEGCPISGAIKGNVEIQVTAELEPAGG